MGDFQLSLFWQVRAVTASINGTWSEPISLGMFNSYLMIVPLIIFFLQIVLWILLPPVPDFNT